VHVVHGLLNVASMALFGASFVARREGLGWTGAVWLRWDMLCPSLRLGWVAIWFTSRRSVSIRVTRKIT
jgi:hypothetical protein